MTINDICARFDRVVTALRVLDVVAEAVNASGHLTDEQVEELITGTDPFYDIVEEYLGWDFRADGDRVVPDTPIIRDVQALVEHVREGNR